MKNMTAFVTGVLFALGLGLSGLMRPDVILGFLDFSGEWNPQLLVAMAASSGAYAVAWHLKGHAPLLGGTFPNPRDALPDLRMTLGSLTFGAGWGLAGICPGPAVATLGEATPERLVFFASMIGGMMLFRWQERLRLRLLDRARPGQPMTLAGSRR